MPTTTPDLTSLAQQMIDLTTKWQVFFQEQKDWLAGTPDGGPNHDGKYPLTNFRGQTYLVPCPAADAARVDGEANSALAYANQANTAMAGAQTYLTQSGMARDAASDFANAAVAARDLARTYADEAGSFARTAQAYAEQAQASAGDLQVAVSDAHQARDDARVAEQGASTFADASALSATKSAASAAAAAASADRASAVDPTNYYNKAASDQRFAPITGVAGNFGVGGNATINGGITGASISSAGNLWSGGTVTATKDLIGGANFWLTGTATISGEVWASGRIMSIGGNITARAANVTGNSNYWMLDEQGISRSVMFWNRSEDALRIRKFSDSTGTAWKDLVFTGTGNLTVPGQVVAGDVISAPNVVAGGLTADNQVAVRHTFPLVGFMQPGVNLGTEESFIGGWGKSLLGRAWGDARGSAFAEFNLSYANGFKVYSAGTSVFQVNPNGTTSAAASIMSMGTSAAIGAYDRSDSTRYAQWYYDGARWRHWNNSSGEVFSIGSSGDVQVNGAGAQLTVKSAASYGYLTLVGGNATNTGYVSFYKANGARAGYIGWGDQNTGRIDLVSENGFYYNFNVRPTFNGSYLVATDTFSVNLSCAVASGSGNYNGLVRNGVYRINDGNSEVNFAPGTQYGQMLVMNNGSDTTTQLAMGYDTGTNTGFKAYYRGSSGWGGNWGKWRALWDDDMLVVSANDPGAVAGRIWIQI